MRNIEEELTPHELRDWQVFARLEPIGNEVFERLHARHLMATMRGRAELEDIYPLTAEDKREAERQQAEYLASLPPEENPHWKALWAQARSMEQAAKKKQEHDGKRR